MASAWNLVLRVTSHQSTSVLSSLHHLQLTTRPITSSPIIPLQKRHTSIILLVSQTMRAIFAINYATFFLPFGPSRIACQCKEQLKIVFIYSAVYFIQFSLVNVLQRRPCCRVHVLLLEFGPKILCFSLFPRWHIWKFHSLILDFFITSVLIKDSEAVGLLLSNLQQNQSANFFILRCYTYIVIVFTIVTFYLLQSSNLLDISFLSTNSALDFILKIATCLFSWNFKRQDISFVLFTPA